MSATENKAVFLSYASQDAEAARRICEALRAAGVEVWFDQSELVGGDAWDAKIRKQIRDCALFVPVISAATQARTEGYFRLEWRLADQRTHLMAKGRPFLLPVVIDATRDAEAHVPDSFTEVQWTRLPGGETPPAFGERVKKLLGAESGPGFLPASGTLTHGQDARATPNIRTPSPRSWLLPAALAGIVALAFAGWQMLREKPSDSSGVGAGPASPPAASVSAWTPRDPELAKAWRLITDLDFTWDDLEIAGDMVKQVLQQRPGDADAPIVQTWTMALSLSRGEDPSRQRHTAAIAAGERAVRLAEDNPWALAGLAKVLPDPPRAEKLARLAIKLNPHEVRFYGVLSEIVAGRDREEAIKLLQDAAKILPRDPLIPYEIFVRYAQGQHREEGEPWLDKSIELRPTGPAMLFKAGLAFGRGDLETVKRMIEELPEKWRMTDRALFWRYLYARFSGQPDYALQALEFFPRPMIRDYMFTGPKAVLMGDILMQAGKPELAREHFEPVLAALRQDALRAPARPPTPDQVWLLLATGRPNEAQAAADRLPPELLKADASKPPEMWSNVVLANLLLGRRAEALVAAREYARVPAIHRAFRFAFAQDPHLKPWRDDPEFKAIFAEPEKTADNETSAKLAPDPKSIAVLPFRNMSDEKDSAFFTDGVQEDILMHLAHLHELRVISRTSVEQYRDTKKPIREIAQELGVAWVLEGSVRRAGQKVRVTGQLINGQTDQQLWGEEYNKDLTTTDIFAIQSELAEKIAGSLHTVLSPVEKSRLKSRPTENLEAYELYLKARAIKNASLSYGGPIKQVEMLERAVELDPGFVAAWCDLSSARTENYGTLYVDHSAASLARAKFALDTATRLAPESVEVLHATGDYFYRGLRDYDRARPSYDKIIQLYPNDPSGYEDLGLMLRRQGLGAESVAHLRRVAELDPRNLRNLQNLVRTLADYRRFEDARLVQRQKIERSPDDRKTHERFRLAYLAFQATGEKSELTEWLAGLPAGYANSPAGRGLRSDITREFGDTETVVSLDRQTIDRTGPSPGGRLRDEASAVIDAACALAASGDRQGAARRVEPLEADLRDALRTQPDHYGHWCYLGHALALQGKREEALRCGRKAMEVMPISVDVRFGTFARVRLGIIHAWLGDNTAALTELAGALRTNGFAGSVHQMRHDPAFFPLRGDPRFEALLNDPKNNAPLF